MADPGGSSLIRRLALDANSYRPTAVKKAAYRLAERFSIAIEGDRDGKLEVALHFRPGTSDAAIDEHTRAFLAELLDQELREQLAEETAPVRALILAQAFSKTGLIRE